MRLSGRKMDLEVVGWWWPPVDTVTEWMNAQLSKLSFPRSCSGEVGEDGCARTRKGQSVAPSGLVEAGGEDCRSAISIGRNAIPSEVARTREQAHEVLMSAGLNQPLPPVASPSSRHVSSPPASWENFSRPRLDPIFFPPFLPFFLPSLAPFSWSPPVGKKLRRFINSTRERVVVAAAAWIGVRTINSSSPVYRVPSFPGTTA